MKGGMVVQIRVNPKDCLAILDLMEILNINAFDGRSFASCVSVGFSSLIGVARKGGIIKAEEDEWGDQWMNRMQPFLGKVKKNDKKKKAVADALYNRACHGMSAPGLPELETENRQVRYAGGIKSEGVDSLSADLTEEDKDRLFQEYSDLNEKMNNPDVEPEDKMRYRELGKMLGYE